MTDLTKLSKIEQLLLDKEIEKFNKEFLRGMEIIQKALEVYGGTMKINTSAYKITTTEFQEFKDYCGKLNLVATRYYGGDYLVFLKQIHPPEFLKKIMLAKIIPDFLEQVEQIQEIATQLEK